MELEALLDAYGLALIFGVMLLKSIGMPIPIPADAIMLATSARVAAGRMSLLAAFVALLVALAVGGVIQFMLVRRIGRGVLLRAGKYIGITAERLDAAARRLEQGGVIGIGVAILTPGIRSVTVPACGIAGIAPDRFARGLVLGSALFLALHFFLGYVGGTLLAQVGAVVSLPVLIGGIVVLLALAFAVWVLIRRRQMPDAPTAVVLASAAGAWHEAVCPACLALGAVERLQIDHPVQLHHRRHSHVH